MYEELRAAIEQAKKIVFFGGAGVSTESGIPDFRSEDGLYNAKQDYGRSPEEMLSVDFFMTHPDIFFDYYKKNMIAKDVMPNNAHKAIAKLESLGKLTAVVTQNIDGLHQKAGSKNVLELHGSVHRNTCMGCHSHYDLDFILDEKNCKDGVPICPKCGRIIKPDVVLYGECLDELTIELSVKAISECDMLIIGGTSLVVYPAAGFVNYFNRKAPNHKLIIINKSETGQDQWADLHYADPIGQVLGEAVKEI